MPKRKLTIDPPYLIRTGSFVVCAPPKGTENPASYPLRSGYEHELDVIDAPDVCPAGGVHAAELKGVCSWMSQAASRY